MFVKPFQQFVDLAASEESSRVTGAQRIHHSAERRILIPRDVQDLEFIPVADVSDLGRTIQAVFEFEAGCELLPVVSQCPLISRHRKFLLEIETHPRVIWVPKAKREVPPTSR